MTAFDDMRRDLLLMCSGDTDGHALWLLDTALDSAASELPVDIESARAHCHRPATDVGAASIGVLILVLVESVGKWMRETDPREAETWALEILSDLFVLRHGTFPCAACLHQCYSVAQLQPRAVGSLWCDVHHTPSLHELFGGNRPLALVKSVA